MNKKLIIILSLFLISIILTGCTEVKYEDGGKTTSPKSTEASLKILSHSMKRDGNEFFETITVEGTAQNTGDKQLSYAEIRVKFYDNSGALLDTSLDNTNDLDSGEKWKFKVMYLGSEGEEIDNYKIAVGTGF